MFARANDRVEVVGAVLPEEGRALHESFRDLGGSDADCGG